MKAEEARKLAESKRGNNVETEKESVLHAIKVAASNGDTNLKYKMLDSSLYIELSEYLKELDYDCMYLSRNIDISW